jgi:hypothetical protein
MTNNVTLPHKGSLVLNGGTLMVKKRLVIPGGAKVIVYDGELDGDGEVEVRPGGQLFFSGNKSKHLKGIKIINQGDVTWGGKGRIDCDADTVFQNDGNLYLSNGNHVHERGQAQFTNRGLIKDISRGQGATIDGNLTNFGRIELNAAAAPNPSRSRRGRKKPMEPFALPTPTLVTITGTLGTSGSTFQTTIRSDYYGQLYVSGTVTLSGGTLKYVLDPTTYLPPNANTYDIINAGTIGGTPGDFTSFLPSPFRFDRQKITVNSRRMYQLYSFN